VQVQRIFTRRFRKCIDSNKLTNYEDTHRQNIKRRYRNNCRYSCVASDKTQRQPLKSKPPLKSCFTYSRGADICSSAGNSFLQATAKSLKRKQHKSFQVAESWIQSLSRVFTLRLQIAKRTLWIFLPILIYGILELGNENCYVESHHMCFSHGTNNKISFKIKSSL
jgi:hypothetical protein